MREQPSPYFRHRRATVPTMFMLDAARRLRLCERDAQDFHPQRSRSPGDVRILRKLRRASHDPAAGGDFDDPEGWNAKRRLDFGSSQAVVVATRLRRPSHAVRNASCAGISKTPERQPKPTRRSLGKRRPTPIATRNTLRVNPISGFRLPKRSPVGSESAVGKTRKSGPRPWSRRFGAAAPPRPAGRRKQRRRS